MPDTAKFLVIMTIIGSWSLFLGAIGRELFGDLGAVIGVNAPPWIITGAWVYGALRYVRENS